MTTNPTPPTHLHPSEEQLNDFVDALLGEAETARVRHHLELCAVCRAEVEDVRALLLRADAAPREIAPPRDLWAGIRTRCADSTADSADPRPASPVETTPVEVPRLVTRLAPPPRIRHPLTRHWMPLAAAAVALIVLSSAVTSVLMKPVGLFSSPQGSGAPAGATARVLVPRLNASVEPAALARPGEAADTREPQSIGAAERTFESAAADLRVAFEARKSQLKPGTVAVVEENLRVIDQALNRARAALESDPGNPDLNSMVTSTWKKKVELLDKAVRLSSEI